ncbi:MAG: hypothetical protein FJ118_15585 [Deltaproteobacteria bacterium]|nr:hypothetical protein [Deltaproteobacteria bacterium]
MTRTALNSSGFSENKASPIVDSVAEGAFDEQFLAQISDFESSDFTAGAALDLLGRLIAHVPVASKDSMEKIKLLDKLINTARHMMETKLKMDDAAAVMKRLEDMEAQIEQLSK